MRDPAKILGISEHATADEIRAAYLRLAGKNHPDHGGSSSTFKEIQWAYEVLIDRVAKNSNASRSNSSPPRAPPKEPIDSSPIQLRASLRRRRRSASGMKLFVQAIVGGSVGTACAYVLLYFITGVDYIGAIDSVLKDGRTQGKTEIVAKSEVVSNRQLTRAPSIVPPKPKPSSTVEGSLPSPENLPSRAEQSEVVAAEGFVVTSTPSEVSQTARSLLPCPSLDEQTVARQAVAELYKPKYSVAQSKDEKLALSQEIFDGARTEFDSATKYVMLEVAKGISRQNGGLAETIRIIEETAKEFDIDASEELCLVVKHFNSQWESDGRLNEIDTEYLQMLAASLGQRAVGMEDYSKASELFEIASKIATRCRQTSASKRLLFMSQKTKERHEQMLEFERAREVLSTRPDDEIANLTLGYFHLIRGDHPTAIEHLAKGSDATLRNLLMQEASEKTQNEHWADQWWSLVESEDPLQKHVACIRSMNLYTAIAEVASGLAKRKSEERILRLKRVLASYDMEMNLPSSDPIVVEKSSSRDGIEESSELEKTFSAIKSFIGTYRETVDGVDKRETRVQKAAGFAKLPNHMNSTLRNQRWTLQFPIIDVAEAGPGGTYRLKLGVPAELQSLGVTFQSEAIMRMSAAQALRLVPEKELLQVSGRPQFLTRLEEGFLIDLRSVGPNGFCVGFADVIRPKLVSMGERKSTADSQEVSSNKTSNDSTAGVSFGIGSNATALKPVSKNTMYCSVTLSEDKAIVHVHNFQASVFEMEVELNQSSGVKVFPSGIQTQGIASQASRSGFVVIWRNKRITEVKWKSSLLPLHFHGEGEYGSIGLADYEMPSLYVELGLFSESVESLSRHFRQVKENLSSGAVQLIEPSLIETHDWYAGIPLGVEYCPYLASTADGRVLNCELARVTLDVGKGSDGIPRIVTLVFRREAGGTWVERRPAFVSSRTHKGLSVRGANIKPGRRINHSLSSEYEWVN